MSGYATPTPTPGTTPRSVINGTGVPAPVAPMPPPPVQAPPPAAAPTSAPAPTAAPSVSTIAAGQRMALTTGYDANANAALNAGGKQGLLNYGGMVGPAADTISKLDGFQI